MTYIQEALRHAFGQAFLLGGAPGPDQAKKQQEIVDSLKITNLYSYEDGGYLRIRGDVTNTGNAAVSSIQIEIQYLDSNGNVVDQGTAYVNGHLLPGKTGTFSTMQSLKDIAHVAYQTRVVVAYPADESDVQQKQQLLEALRIENLYSHSDGGYLRLRGDVTNTGNIAAKVIQIEIQYQDSQGKTVDQGTAYVDDSAHVLPGKTGTFTVTQSTRKGLITSYKTRVVGAYPATEPEVQQKQQILDGLKIQNLSDRTQGGYMRIRGDVTNAGSVPVKSITVELLYLDAQGRVVDQSTAYVDSGVFVLPGKTGTFTATQSTRKGAVVSYRARIVPSFYTQ